MARLVCAVLLVVCLAPARPAAQAQALDGLWQGTVPLAQPAMLVVDFDAGTATFNGSQPVPITKSPSAADGAVVVFDVAAGGRAYRFSGRRDGARIVGTFVGQSVSLVRLPDSSARLALRKRYPLPPASSRDADAIAQARAAVTELMRAQQIPGFSIAVARAGAVVWSEGFGAADVEQRVPVTTATRFRVGSISKVLTAAGVARLVEDGKLDLDAPIQRYVPSFPSKPWPITTRQLAAHTAGIRHYAAGDFSGVLRGAPHYASVRESLGIFQDDPLLFEPGSGYSYSSYGWNLISAVVEGAAGEEFLAFMQRAVFEPLGLRSVAADHVDAIVADRTRFYSREAPGRPLENARYVDNSYKWAGGGFLASAEDLVRFGSAHLQPGFFRQSTLDALFARRVAIPPDGATGVGIGWRIGVDPQQRRILHHGGTIEGGRAVIVMFPDARVVVAMLANILADFGESEAQKIGALFIRD